jgi:uncharacterized protein with von Willebrand factor type A (vWA) domain
MSHRRTIDAVRSLREVDWTETSDFRYALRANFASTRAQEITFDRVFDAFWLDSPSEGHRIKMRSEFVRGDLDQGFREGHEEAEGKPLDYSAEKSARELHLIDRWDEEAPPVEAAIRELAKRLATRPSRRTKSAPRGRRIDMRRTLRANARRGSDLAILARSTRRVRKTRIAMLCDVSGSMDAFNPFLLRLMFGLQKELKNSRTVVFSTQSTEISTQLRHKSVGRTLREVGRAVQHWSGGTDIGAALRELNRGILREGSPRSTVAIIISDGYDQGETERITREMRALRRRVRTVVWINPMYGSMSYQPTAKGMRAALPFVDHFLPAWDVESLRTLVRELATL